MCYTDILPEVEGSQFFVLNNYDYIWAYEADPEAAHSRNEDTNFQIFLSLIIYTF